MTLYEETAATWNQLAQAYQDRFMDLDLYNESYDYLCGVLPHDARVLEIGCGPGNITRYLLTKRPDLQVLGTDIAPDMVELARKNNPGARFEVMDARALHQLDGPFEAIVIGFCIPYLAPDDLRMLLTTAHRLLLPGGLVYLSFVEGQTEQSGYQTGSTGHRLYFWFYETDQLQIMLDNAGFSITQTCCVAYAPQQNEHIILIGNKTI